jgi:hypothetical protein
LVLVVGVLASFFTFPGAFSSADPASANISNFCRSTTGNGATFESDSKKNGFFENTNLRIEPVYAKRMYADFRAGYDAMYIAYRVTNRNDAATGDLWISLDNWGNSPVQLARSRDSLQRIGSVPGSTTDKGVKTLGARTSYFLIKADRYTDDRQTHTVNIWSGSNRTTPLISCTATIDGVQRSISARANKVTSIVASPVVVGSTMTITVKGTPGTIGSGSASPDGDVMTLSPTNYSAWPTVALELTNVSTKVEGFKAANLPSDCINASSGIAGSGNDKSITFNNRLVLRNFAACSPPSAKTSYTTTYTFRVNSKPRTNPSIVPVSDISSGTQIKYTGGYPSGTFEVGFDEATVSSTISNATVVKSFVGPATVSGDRLLLPYRITASNTQNLTIDTLEDFAPPGAQIVGQPTVTDSTSTRNVTPVRSGLDSAPVFSFVGPFTVTSSTNAVVNYTVSVPFVDNSTETYTNTAYGQIGSLIIGSNTNRIGGIQLVVQSSGGAPTTVTPTTLNQKLPQEITFNPPSVLGEGATTVLNGWSDSGLPVSYAVVSGDCTISEFNGIFTLTMVGNVCDVVAKRDEPDDSDYMSASSPVRRITSLPAQVITADPPTLTLASQGAEGPITFTSTSGLEVIVTNLTEDVCEITKREGTNVTYDVKALTNGGSCILSASQPGSDDFAPAQDLDVTIGIGKTQSLAFVTPPTSSTIGAKPGIQIRSTDQVTGVATDLAVDLSSLSPSVCTVLPAALDSDGAPLSQLSGGTTTVTIEILTFGECVLQADQDGVREDGTQSAYAPAVPVRHTITIASVTSRTQTITLTTPTSKTYGDASFEVSAISRENADGNPATGLLVSIQVVSGPCVITATSLDGQNVSRAFVSLTGAGECIFRGTQGGSNLFSTATPVDNSASPLVIGKKTLSVLGLTAETREYDGELSVTLNQTTISLSGVVSGDSLVDVRLSGTATASRTSPNVGPEEVTVAGLSLAGDKASSSYLLVSPTVTATITARPITVKPQDLTLQQGSSQPTSCEAEIVFGSLVGEELISLVCDFSTYDTNTPAGTISFTIVSVNVGDSGVVDSWDGNVTTAGNYVVTRQSGTITVTNDIVPEILASNGSALADIEVVYGEEIPVDTPVVKNGQDDVAGTVTQKINVNGTPTSISANGDYGVGNYTVTVQFTPSGSGVSSRTVYRELRVTKRPVSYSFTPPSKVYDGNATLTLSGFQLTSTGATASGVVESDAASVSLSAPSTAAATAGADVNSGLELVYTAPTLTGPSAANYRLDARTTPITGSITQRPIALFVADFARFVGDPDPTFTIQASPGGANEGIAPTDDLDTVLGASPSVTKAGYTQDLPGAFDLVPVTPNQNANYNITRNNGKLYIAQVTFTLQTEPGTNVLTDREFVCDCEGFLPSTDGSPSTATLEIRSTPQTLATIPIDANGSCQRTTVTIPGNVDDGPHSLVLTGSFPTGDPAARTLPVVLQTPVGQNSSPPTTSPTPTSPTPPPGRTTPSTDPAPSPVVTPPTTQPQAPNGQFPNLLAPVTPPLNPSPLGPQANGGVDGANGTNPLARNLQSPLSAIVERSQSPENTFDLGVDDLNPSQLGGSGSSAKAGTRTVGEIREESLGGFDPGTALRVEVIGSRTTARFVVSTLTGLDELVLIEQISRSSEGNRLDFAGIDNITIGSPTGPQNAWTSVERDFATDLFNYSRLNPPTKQSDLLGNSSYTWLNIEKGVRGYLPGSTVYLTATSSPLVFGEAEVGLNGEAVVTGDLAVELLGLGEHRLRVIGTRVFTDIQVDADGEVIIPDFVLDQILLFDMGTDATVIVTGNNPTGGVHTVMRVVPLDPVSPWWTLWVIGWTALLLLVGRLRRMIRTFPEKSVASGAVLVSSIPALWLGWTSTVTQVAWWGLLMGLVLSAAMWIVPALPHRKGRSGGTPPDDSGPEEPEPRFDEELVASTR